MQTHRQIIRYLSPRGNNYSLRYLQFDNIHYPLEGKFIEIQAVAGIVIRAYRFGIVINHDRTIPHFPNRVQGTHPAPVKFHATADTIRPRPQHDNRTTVTLVRHVIFRAIVRDIKIIRHGRILSRQRVYLLHDGQNTQFFTVFPHFQHLLVMRKRCIFNRQPTYLKIGKPVLLCRPQ